jgi:hypothetical protein
VALDEWRRALDDVERGTARDGVGGVGDREKDQDGPPTDAGLPAPPVLGRLRSALEDVLVRDAVLLLLVPGTGRLPDRLVAGDAGEEVGAALQRVVDPGCGVPPEEVTVRAAERLLRAVGAHAPGHPAVPTLLAVLAWWQGDGARAGVLLERALELDATYRLASLVQEALGHGMPPGWLAARRDRDGTPTTCPGPSVGGAGS